MGRETIDEFIVYLCVDDNAVCTHANLALMQVSADHSRPYGMLDVGIIQDNARRISAKLKRDTFHPGPAHGELPDVPANFR